MTATNRGSVGPPSRAAATPHVWERWLPAWHAVFASAVVLTTLGGVLDGHIASAELPVALVGVGLVAAGYAAMFVVRRPWEASRRIALAYLFGIGLVWGILLTASPTYFWLQPVLFSQVFFLLEGRRWWLPPIAWIVAIVLFTQYRDDPRPLPVFFPQAFGIILPVIFFVLLSTWIGAIIEQSGERAELIARLEDAQRELAERERQAGVHEERERLARELHDTLAQDLLSIVTHLQAADAAADAAAAVRHRDEAARTARDGLAETRRIVRALRPEVLETGTLLESLERTIDRWRSASGLAATLTVTGRPRALHPDVEIALLRTLQEGLANAARHAEPSEVTVSLSYLGDVVTLDVHDDGRGFDPTDARPRGDDGGGLGLVGMRERAERLGGSVAVESAPGEGTTIGLTLPALGGS